MLLLKSLDSAIGGGVLRILWSGRFASSDLVEIDVDAADQDRCFVDEIAAFKTPFPEVARHTVFTITAARNRRFLGCLALSFWLDVPRPDSLLGIEPLDGVLKG